MRDYTSPLLLFFTFLNEGAVDLLQGWFPKSLPAGVVAPVAAEDAIEEVPLEAAPASSVSAALCVVVTAFVVCAFSRRRRHGNTVRREACEEPLGKARVPSSQVSTPNCSSAGSVSCSSSSGEAQGEDDDRCVEEDAANAPTLLMNVASQSKGKGKGKGKGGPPLPGATKTKGATKGPPLPSAAAKGATKGPPLPPGKGGIGPSGKGGPPGKGAPGKGPALVAKGATCGKGAKSQTPSPRGAGPGGSQESAPFGARWIRWQPVQSVAGTVFEDLVATDETPHEPDAAQMLRNIFEPSASASKPASAARSGFSTRPSGIELLSNNRAQQLAIVYRRLPIRFEHLCHLLEGLDFSMSIEEEEIESLLQVWPNASEQDQVMKHKGLASELRDVEQCVRRTALIPRTDSRLKLIRLSKALNTMHRTSREKVKLVHDACRRLLESSRWRILLREALVVGNFFNRGLRTGGVQGFRIDTLLSMRNIKGAGGASVLHCLCASLAKKEPGFWHALESELDAVFHVAKSPLCLLREDIHKLRNELTFAVNELRMHPEAYAETPPDEQSDSGLSLIRRLAPTIEEEQEAKPQPTQARSVSAPAEISPRGLPPHGPVRTPLPADVVEDFDFSPTGGSPPGGPPMHMRYTFRVLSDSPAPSLTQRMRMWESATLEALDGSAASCQHCSESCDLPTVDENPQDGISPCTGLLPHDGHLELLNFDALSSEVSASRCFADSLRDELDQYTTGAARPESATCAARGLAIVLPEQVSRMTSFASESACTVEDEDRASLIAWCRGDPTPDGAESPALVSSAGGSSCGSPCGRQRIETSPPDGARSPAADVVSPSMSSARCRSTGPEMRRSSTDSVLQISTPDPHDDQPQHGHEMPVAVNVPNIFPGNAHCPYSEFCIVGNGIEVDVLGPSDECWEGVSCEASASFGGILQQHLPNSTACTMWISGDAVGNATAFEAKPSTCFSTGQAVTSTDGPRARLQRLISRGEVLLSTVEEDIEDTRGIIDQCERYFVTDGEDSNKENSKLFATVAEVLAAFKSTWDEVQRDERFHTQLGMSGAKIVPSVRRTISASGEELSAQPMSARESGNRMTPRRRLSMTPASTPRRSIWGSSRRPLQD